MKKTLMVLAILLFSSIAIAEAILPIGIGKPIDPTIINPETHDFLATKITWKCYKNSCIGTNTIQTYSLAATNQLVSAQKNLSVLFNKGAYFLCLAKAKTEKECFENVFSITIKQYQNALLAERKKIGTIIETAKAIQPVFDEKQLPETMPEK